MSVSKKTVNDFEFGETIGEGSYSTVVLGIEKSTGLKYAIKVLDKRHIIKEHKVKYVTIEKDVLFKLNHPFIIKLYFTFQDNSNLCYFVLDFAVNGDLLGLIKKYSKLPLLVTKIYAAQILLALEFMHSQQIYHRDLKPENILLDSNFNILITDFGTAKILNDENRFDLNSFVGTAEYVPPELLSDKQNAKIENFDLWAFGCLVFQMLVGKPPFKGFNEYQTFQQVLNVNFDIPDFVDEISKDFVKQLLQKDPSSRLGFGNDKWINLKTHPFFTGIIWDNLNQIPLDPLPPQESTFNAHLLESENIISIVNVKKKSFPFKKNTTLIFTSTPRLLCIDSSKNICWLSISFTGNEIEKLNNSDFTIRNVVSF